MSKITKVSSSAEFGRILSGNTHVVVDFYADWCGPCKAIAPIFEQLATSHGKPGKVAFCKVDVDSQQDIARQYGVSAMPTFLIFTSSKVTNTIRGANPSALRSAVTSLPSSGAAASSSAFGSKGYTLGSEGPARAGTTGGAANAGGAGIASTLAGGGLGSWADSAVRFGGLYLTTLFSFDAKAAAEASPFSVANSNARPGSGFGGSGRRL